MTRRQKDSLRPLTDQERHDMERLSRAQAEPAAIVARAKALIAVAGGQSFTDAARTAGRRSGDAVGQLVARFNRKGLAALDAVRMGRQTQGTPSAGAGAAPQR